MIYFSQLHLNPFSRMVQRELASPYEMHRTLLKAFGMTRQQAGMLHRVEASNRGVCVLVQSAKKPNWQVLHEVGQGKYLLQIGGVKSADFTLPLDATYRFRLRASPTVSKRRHNADGTRRNSNRVPLVREDKQSAWLLKKGQDQGFRILRNQISDPRRDHDHRKKITTFSVLYEGILQVADAEKFNTAWHSGIGPSKAFGCGLLSLASV